MMPFVQRRISAKGPFREILAVAGLTLAMLAPMCVEAEQHFFNNPREMFLLPEYCKYTQDFRANVPGGNNPGEIQRWTTLMGPVFIHMHHYCYGLQAINRATFLSPAPEDRRHNLGVSVIEFDYVIERAPQDFGLLPEIFTKKGESLLQMDSVGKGIAELQRAIDMKPDYWQAYAAASDYYKGAGQPAKAREWVEKGLSVLPDKQPLLRRQAELNAPRNKSASNPQPSVRR
ncbi:MAG TPA: hypothetical protein VK572_07500 [Burkholderiales bacterium]|nr:hypothetical protein [Burkholderiales bacterium]